ncbi:MAG: thiolase C-terminal domain-containing protein [Rhodopila sp.]
MGALRIASGEFQTQLVVAWSPSEVAFTSEAQRLGMDPYFHRALPLDEPSAHALQAAAIEAAQPGARSAAQSVVWPACLARSAAAASRWAATVAGDARHDNGTGNRQRCDGDGFAQFCPAARTEGYCLVRSMGWATEPSFLSDRNLATAPALSAAAQRAYADASVADPMTAFDLAEITDATPYSELLAYDALSLCQRQDWNARLTAAGDFSRGGRLPVNLSGGVLTWNPLFCTGMIRITELAAQIRGRAGAHQMADVNCGLAQAGSGFAMQYQAAIVLGKEARP